jgi:tyrosinase
VQADIVHNVGAFLPWHRYHIRAHELLLQNECGYSGAQPYWDEQADVDAGPLAEASPWGDDKYSFGGDGRRGDGCVVDGPFANLTLRMGMDNRGVQNFTEYCLNRVFEPDSNPKHWNWADRRHVEECYNRKTYRSAYECYNIKPHVSAHVAVGGTVSCIVWSSESSLPPHETLSPELTCCDRSRTRHSAQATQSSGYTTPTWTACFGGGSRPTSPHG